MGGGLVQGAQRPPLMAPCLSMPRYHFLWLGGRGRHPVPQAVAAFPFTVAVVLTFTRLRRGTLMAQGEPRGTVGHPSGAWGKAGSVPPSFWGSGALPRGEGLMVTGGG